MSGRSASVDPRRSPELSGGRNFRDLGGYPTEDGRTVQWGKVYRSGSLAAVTGEGVETLHRLGLAGVCDLRTTRERAAEPYHWAAELGLSYWSRDYETSFGELRTLMASGLASGSDAKEAMLAGYRRLPYEQAPAYRELFRRLVANEVPLVFNCSAGKDRAGTAAALVLLTLGVSPDIIAEDYALTDRFGNLEGLVASSRANPESMLGKQPPDVIHAILGCDPDYIRTGLLAVAPTAAAFATYLDEVLGVDEAARRRIQDNLLTPRPELAMPRGPTWPKY